MRHPCVSNRLPAKPLLPRTYVAKRLLEHGPLTPAEFREITGWPFREAQRTLQSLRESGVALRETAPCVRYRLAA